MREQFSLFVTFWIAIVLIVMGFEGSLGKVLACIFCPAIVTVEGEF